MNYREIVSVTGAGGLYQLVGSKGDGALLRQLGENVVKFMPARKHSITQLETIEVYTTADNVPLHEVFRKMQEHSSERPASKASNAEIKAYFQEVYPELDADRVYVSDMKKMLKWYDILEQNDMLQFPEPGSETETDEAAGPDVAVVTEAMVAEEQKPDETDLGELSGEAADGEKPAKKASKKAAPKKAAAKAEAGEEGAEAAPKKKTAKKKKEEE